jgi:tRNA pseudouridine55 synthase
LKTDGKPLREYARNGIYLPRPIKPREMTVYALELEHRLGAHHSFSWPQKEFSTDEKKALETALKSTVQGDSAAITIEDHPELSSPTSDDVAKPSAFILNMKVSFGGTYVRFIVHDLSSAPDRLGGPCRHVDESTSGEVRP